MLAPYGGALSAVPNALPEPMREIAKEMSLWDIPCI
jgi:hypothetical protein